jgi:hypothetical protein
MRRRRRREPGSDDRGRFEALPGPTRHERFFFRCEEEIACGLAEVLLEHVEAHGGIFFGRRNEHGAIRDDR